MQMSETTCRRELDLEIPAEEVQKALERVAKEFARIARVPGFRPGKAPVTLIRRRFAGDIKSEVLQSLVPEHLEKAVTEKNLRPVSQPQVEKIDFSETGPLKFRATFEVLPDFQLGEYKNLEVEIEPLDLSGGGEPLQADNVLCHIGAEETIDAFNQNLRGASAGEHKKFDVVYPADFPDAKLAGKTFHYSVEVLGIKTKKLPELNDEFAKDVSDAATL